MTPRSIALSLVFIACARIASAADLAPPKTIEELKVQVEKAVKDHNVPAIGIAVVNRQGPIWVAGWGKADIASDQAANEDTLFRIGSVSKMFAALAVLKLVEEGKLSLDDTLRDRAPDVAFDNPWEATHPVRIAHLLEHTTGWDDIHFPEYAYSAPDTMTVKAGLDFHPHSRTSRWPPGARQAYCNAGPAVAAYVVEKITGQRFEDYVAKQFFAPLGMDSTSYFRTKLYEERGATLYVGDKPQEYWHIIHRPAGSINSSARDMAQFLHFMLMRGSTSAGPIVSEASIERMETPKTLPGNDQGVLAGYGLANYTTGHKALGVAFHGHNGGVMGGLTEFAYVRELGEGYVFTINSGNGAAFGQISNLFKDYLTRNAHWTEVKSPDLPERYKNVDGYYQPINPRFAVMRFMADFMGVYQVTHDDKVLHRSPLLGNWTSSDHVGPGEVLVDRWSGLPTIAVIEDPLEGPSLLVGTDTLQRVSGWTVLARFLTGALVIVMSIAGLVALFVWAVRRKKTGDGRLWMRVWPLIASGALVCFMILLGVAGGYLNEIGTVSLLSVAILAVSLAYPAAVLSGAGSLFTDSNRARRNLPWWFALAFVAVHLVIAVYLASRGLIGLRTWT